PSQGNGWGWARGRNFGSGTSLFIVLALGGALLVKNQQELKFLEGQGPMTILKGVAVPREIPRSSSPELSYSVKT
ncbi:MAG: hypothetical protein O6840_06750, partial [Nitrospirae bacterium]|nr:hypothetical protein [Nitrospirota bacterium]